VLPDGSTVAADPYGRFILPIGAVARPDGTGGVILPNGTRWSSDGARDYVYDRLRYATPTTRLEGAPKAEVAEWADALA
jgi:hypothetical protein